MQDTWKYVQGIKILENYPKLFKIIQYSVLREEALYEGKLKLIWWIPPSRGFLEGYKLYFLNVSSVMLEKRCHHYCHIHDSTSISFNQRVFNWYGSLMTVLPYYQTFISIGNSLVDRKWGWNMNMVIVSSQKNNNPECDTGEDYSWCMKHNYKTSHVCCFRGSQQK